MADGFDQPFPDRESEELGRALGVMEVIALESIRRLLPAAVASGDAQVVVTAGREIAADLRRQFPDERARTAAGRVGRQYLRRSGRDFFRTLALRSNTRVVGLDVGIPDEQVRGRRGPLAIPKANPGPDLELRAFEQGVVGRVAVLRDGVGEAVAFQAIDEALRAEGQPQQLTRQLIDRYEEDGVPSQVHSRRLTQVGLPALLTVSHHSAFIARNGLGALQSGSSRSRQVAAGIQRFVWVSRNDSRVRPSHAARNGQTFTWADGAGGEFPGGPPNCRCHARAVVPSPSILRSALLIVGASVIAGALAG